MENAEKGTVLETLRSQYTGLSTSEKKIADYIQSDPDSAVSCNVSELASASGTSDATVVRFCKHLGYSGYYQLRINLSRELGWNDRNQEWEGDGGTIADIMQKFVSNLQFISRRLDEKTVKVCAQILEKCNCVHVVAVGNTAPLAQYAGFRLGRLGIRTTFHMVPEYFLNDIVLAGENDVVLAISQSGTSTQVVKALELAAERNIPIIAVVGYEYSPVSQLSNYLLPAVIPEQSFDYRKNHEHLYEMAVLDALMEVIAKDRKIQNTDVDLQEILFSDSKL